jgi:hypothetical protein
MTKSHKIILALAFVFAGILATLWLVERPKRIAQTFVGHLSHQRYSEAAQMLQTPSAIKVVSEGGIVLVDRDGNSTMVPAERLPFFVGGGQPNGPGDFAMTALQGSINGKVAPVVIAYLSIDGGKIHIERVDAL